MKVSLCSAPGCYELCRNDGPRCEKHGCRRCGSEAVLPAMRDMPEMLCAQCYEDAKKQPAMKKHPSAELIFHVAIEVDADKMSNGDLRRKVLPGLVRNDGKEMTVKLFRRMCTEARRRGFLVLPACEHTNASGQCLGHVPPKVDITTMPAPSALPS